MPSDPLKTARLFDVQTSLHRVVDDIREIGHAFLKDGGLKCEDSQLMCLKNAASNLEHIINGISETDIK